MKTFSIVIRMLVVAFLACGLLINCSSERETFVTDASNQTDLAKESSPPTPSETGDKPEFVDFDVAPKPVEGYKSVIKYLEYPEEARKNKTEGRVVVWLQINSEGKIVQVQIKESVSESCDMAAIEALKKTTWSPAVKAEQSIDSWVAVPIEFRLN